jgi:two-component system NarL family response regulator
MQITPRELATLQLMMDGKSDREIAVSLGISESSIDTHLRDLFAKLGVTSHTEAIGAATRRGLVGWEEGSRREAASLLRQECKSNHDARAS